MTNNNTKCKQREITLKLGLQHTSQILLMCFYYDVRRSVLFKIHAAIIEISKFVVFSVSDGKLFLKISQMLVVCFCYCYNFHIFCFRE